MISARDADIFYTKSERAGERLVYTRESATAQSVSDPKEWSVLVLCRRTGKRSFISNESIGLYTWNSWEGHRQHGYTRS
jgi:hypothetical protein